MMIIPLMHIIWETSAIKMSVILARQFIIKKQEHGNFLGHGILILKYFVIFFLATVQFGSGIFTLIPSWILTYYDFRIVQVSFRGCLW